MVLLKLAIRYNIKTRIFRAMCLNIRVMYLGYLVFF